MRPLLLALLLGLVVAAPAAEIYKRVGPDGSVTYSDQPGPGAEAIDVPPISIIPSRPVPQANAPAPGRSASAGSGSGYGGFAITAPADDETIRDNTGTVHVAATLEPALKPSHRVQFLLDDQPVGEPRTVPSIALADVDRGTHTVSAAVLDSSGREIIRATPVTFHLKRISTLTKPAAPPVPGGAQGAPGPGVPGGAGQPIRRPNLPGGAGG